MQFIKSKAFGREPVNRWERWAATDAPYEVYMTNHMHGHSLERLEEIVAGNTVKYSIKVTYLDTSSPPLDGGGLVAHKALQPVFFANEDVVAPVVLSDVLYNLRRVGPPADPGFVVSVLQALAKAYVIRGGTEHEHGMRVRYNIGQALKEHPEPDERYKKGVVIEPRHVSYRFTYTSRLLPMLK